MVTAIIDVASMTVVAKFIPGNMWPPGAPDPQPADGQVFVEIPTNLCWQALNAAVTQDEQGNWQFTENEEQVFLYWRFLREERTKRLLESDWTQVADSPVDRQAWAVYRQSLRNLPGNTVNPAEPVWPAKPE